MLKLGLKPKERSCSEEMLQKRFQLHPQKQQLEQQQPQLVQDLEHCIQTEKQKGYTETEPIPMPVNEYRLDLEKFVHQNLSCIQAAI